MKRQPQYFYVVYDLNYYGLPCACFDTLSDLARYLRITKRQLYRIVAQLRRLDGSYYKTFEIRRFKVTDLENV